eukprot:656545-Hanusia_phi.AAC.3
MPRTYLHVPPTARNAGWSSGLTPLEEHHACITVRSAFSALTYYDPAGKQALAFRVVAIGQRVP